MVVYTCLRCGYENTIKAHMKKHFLRKNKCLPLISNILVSDCYKNIFGENNIKEDEMILCIDCNMKFKEKCSFDKHFSESHYQEENIIKKENVYKYETDTFGRNLYGKNGGEIYIIEERNHLNINYIIGVTNNLYNRKFKKMNLKLLYYYPIDNITDVEKDLKVKLEKYNLKKNVYKGNINEIRGIIKDMQEREYEIDVNDKKEEVNIQIVNETGEIVQELRKNKSDLENKLEELLIQYGKKIENINITNNTNCNNTTNNTQIVINAFGNERTDYITSDYVKNLIKGGPYTCVPTLLKMIYFNPEHKENCNIMIPNKKQPYVKIYNGTEWKYSDKKKALRQMSNKAYNITVSNYDMGTDPYMELFIDKYDNGDLIQQFVVDAELTVLNNQENILGKIK